MTGPDDEADQRLGTVTARLRAAQANFDRLLSGEGARPRLVAHALVLAGVELESAKAQMERLCEELVLP